MSVIFKYSYGGEELFYTDEETESGYYTDGRHEIVIPYKGGLRLGLADQMSYEEAMKKLGYEYISDAEGSKYYRYYSSEEWIDDVLAEKKVFVISSENGNGKNFKVVEKDGYINFGNEESICYWDGSNQKRDVIDSVDVVETIQKNGCGGMSQWQTSKVVKAPSNGTIYLVATNQGYANPDMAVEFEGTEAEAKELTNEQIWEIVTIEHRAG